MFMILIQSESQVTTANSVVTKSDMEKEALTAELEKTTADLNAIKKEYGSLKRYENGLTIIEENSYIISISIQAGENSRVIFIEEHGNLAKLIDLGWQNRDYASNMLYTVLSESIRKSDAQAVFIVFEYNRNDIYQSDYTLITNSIQRFKQDSHVYTMEYDITLREDAYNDG